jgi:hypothetical protein
MGAVLFLAVMLASQLAQPLVSPDGACVLAGSDSEPQLWLENKRTHERKMVFAVTLQTLTLAWSPDSAAFIANDRMVSDLEVAWIYSVPKLSRLDLRARILAADPKAIRFTPGENRAVHSYTHAIRWLDAKHVEVQLHGHLDDAARAGDAIKPGHCFDLRYRIGTDGSVQKLSQRVAEISDKTGCGSME